MPKRIDIADVEFFGSGLDRPECVLPTASGDIFTSYRHGVARVAQDGTTTLIAGRNRPDDFLPNGIALLPDRSFLLANLGRDGGVWHMDGDGTLTPWLIPCALDSSHNSREPSEYICSDQTRGVELIWQWVTVGSFQTNSRSA